MEPIKEVILVAGGSKGIADEISSEMLEIFNHPDKGCHLGALKVKVPGGSQHSYVALNDIFLYQDRGMLMPILQDYTLLGAERYNQWVCKMSKCFEMFAASNIDLHEKKLMLVRLVEGLILLESVHGFGNYFKQQRKEVEALLMSVRKDRPILQGEESKPKRQRLILVGRNEVGGSSELTNRPEKDCRDVRDETDKVTAELDSQRIGSSACQVDEPVELIGIKHRGTDWTIDETRSILDNAFDLIKADLRLGLDLVKEEPSEDVQNVAEQPRDVRCRDDLIRSLAAGAKKFDPAQNSTALRDAEWRGSIVELDVATLKQTHDQVSTKFRNGPHKGQGVKDLSDNLICGKVSASSITPLVVVRCLGSNWVVFGNRRLKALKDFASATRRQVRMRCIVHEGTRGQDFPIELFAKFLDAMSTVNGGTLATFH
eukprot:gnl/MRDRNA2_/MRDRNA2_23433_c0_seq2.p1 gnl/MRDRNA2_/MRDRNA2_23433_c0~~gnl/MRDRNA2_/MRDRNA2_23433_c0_seq2.p1  ORF type:complete len:460 (-),score=78.75 gnl/MRDRNA2_/MRDRNA2_23433_c0_seq2:70-1356(-)